MVNFFKPNKEDGTVLHLTKSGKWEKCTIPVGCTRHVDPRGLNNMQPGAEVPEWSREAWENRDTTMSADDYNGWEPEEDDPMDDIKMYIRPVANENETVAVKRREYKSSNFNAYRDKVSFKSDHEQCKSYQTACPECAEKHELSLYELFSREELSMIVREDSMFYNPERKQILEYTDVNGEPLYFMSHVMSGVLNELPEYERWEYLPNKSQRQVDFERSGVNFGDHLNDEHECNVCGQYVYDMYCMDCWVPSGYLAEEVR